MFKRLQRSLIDFVFPPICVQCKKVGAILCVDCMANLPRISKTICTRCGRPTAKAVSTCRNCERRPFPLAHIRAPLTYKGPITTIIHKLKYKHQFALAAPLAQIILESWLPDNKPYGIIVPIPLHSQRQKKRGFNQSALLAKHLGEHLKLPVKETALQRIRHTPPQVGLRANERLVNMQGAFQANPQQVSGQSIILIDDVYTTGATMSAAANALLTAGATTVSGYCIAQTA